MASFRDGFNDPVALREQGQIVVEVAGGDERGECGIEEGGGFGFGESGHGLPRSFTFWREIQ